MKPGSTVRFDPTKINHAAAILQAPLLSWDVTAPATGEHKYRVDLSQFNEGTNPNSPPLVHHALARRRVYKPGRAGYSNVAAHPDLIRALAPTIRVWCSSLSLRTVTECLSQLKHLFNFLAVAESIVGVGLKRSVPIGWQLADMSPELFHQFAEYLRRLGLSSIRMNGIYLNAKSIVERAAGIEYLPSSPFSTVPDDDGGSTPQYSHKQMKALLDIAKTTIRSFKRSRRELLRGEHRSDIRKFCRERLETGAVQFTRAPSELPTYIGLNLFPCIRVASAFVLLALLRSGANLQPILDLPSNEWNQPNPFSSRYRTIVMVKNRRGKAKEQRLIKIPTQKRPQFYLYKTLRYYELLVSPLRKAIKKFRKEHADSPTQRKRYMASLDGHFWVHLNNNLETTKLGENAAIRGINLLITEACTQSPGIYECLITRDGHPIRFSSKAIRDGWFEFVLRNSKYNLTAGQIALSHSEDSPSIRHYIRHKWARQYAEREMRRFHSAAVAILDEKTVEFTPQTIRVALDGGEVLALSRENRSRYGAYCRDPLTPPVNVYRPQHESDACPAMSCDDCPYANYFISSLPELLVEIDILKRRSNELPTYVWEGSVDWERLGRLEELLSRFPTSAITTAKDLAKSIDLPDIRFRIT